MPSTLCAYCRRRLFKTQTGQWYHAHNISRACRPGDGGTYAEPGVQR